MKLELIRQDLKSVLKDSRYRHSIGVEEVSRDLACIYCCDIHKAGLAGILHDCAKYLTDEELLRACETYHLPVTDIEKQCGFLLHGKVGAVFAGLKYEVKDEAVLNAIRYHTTGRPNMTLLEKIIFTADYIEPYRRPLPGLDEIRITAYEELDRAVGMILENTLSYLRNKNLKIDTLTVDTYEYYRRLLQG